MQHTVKPLGLFCETNTKMICVVKMSRISFLRPTDCLETLFYFPHCVPVSENIDGGGKTYLHESQFCIMHEKPTNFDSFLTDDRMMQLQMMLKYFEILDVIESTMGDAHRSKLERRLKNSHIELEVVCDQVANSLAEADPRALHLVGIKNEINA